MKKTIVHIAECAGGVDRYIRMLINSLSEDYDHVLLCSQQYDIDNYKDIVSSIEIVRMENDISFSDIVTIFKIRGILKRYNPDIIYCHSSKAGGFGRIASIGMKAKIVYNPHGWAFSMNKSVLKRRIYILIEKLLSRLTDKVVTISNYEKDLALEKGICSSDRLVTILNGIDFEAIDRNVSSSTITRASLGIKDDAFVVGMVGRISEQKAPDIFVKMACIIKKEISNAFFVIVGGGYMKSKIESMIAENGLQNDFLITGWVDNPNGYTALFDQAILLSRWEGFGLVLAEYMYMNKPIVATAVDAIPEIVINNQTGLLVERDDEEQAARAVLSLYKDAVTRGELVMNAKERVIDMYNIKRVADQHKLLFETIQ